jgi:hypothetical protein
MKPQLKKRLLNRLLNKPSWRSQKGGASLRCTPFFYVGHNLRLSDSSSISCSVSPST